MQDKQDGKPEREDDVFDTVSPHQPVRWFFKIVWRIIQALYGGKKKTITQCGRPWASCDNCTGDMWLATRTLDYDNTVARQCKWGGEAALVVNLKVV